MTEPNGFYYMRAWYYDPGKKGQTTNFQIISKETRDQSTETSGTLDVESGTKINYFYDGNNVIYEGENTYYYL